MPQRLALFDLDNTLLAGDSDHAWGEFLIAQQLVDESSHRQKNDSFYQDYLNGELDIHAYVAFTLGPILAYSASERAKLHEHFMQQAVQPLLIDKAFDLVNAHKQQGDFTVIITATNSFITDPIAKLFSVEQLLATDVELLDGKLTGRIAGIPCYQEGKVEKLKLWLKSLGSDLSLANSVFYSDSINDLPLLEQAYEAIAVDPDQELAKISVEKGWQTLSLRG
ncbi:MAG: HAD-IB family hydrolase [Gammaproteobacteria bacterium]|nr:HAD-IB family hydrolase [Gammaproteobacteria bacterium]MDD9896714.1 HAD-IB family hydrolase [Gammaproteobacteria bacterium]MDD9958714.1 HAD-IB family hydrolase [Gammaproteobacteria bacterium]